jgi:regulator of protease activity HflC (stomatin/prohibitin superfamily)
MKYVLDKEKQEAERKRIEAQGIADYQTIINQCLNDNLLKWKGIEATRELARSQNAKVVVIGAGKEGLPIILGNP